MNDVDDVLFDVDFVSCDRCGRELDPRFSDFTNDGDRVCCDCLSDAGVEDAWAERLHEHILTEIQSQSLIQRGLLSADWTRSQYWNCACCGYYFEPSFGVRSIFGFKLCARCEIVPGTWGRMVRSRFGL